MISFSPKEQEFSDIIKELYNMDCNTEDWHFSDKWLDLTDNEIKEIFDKTIMFWMENKIMVDLETYRKLTIFIRLFRRLTLENKK